MSDIDEREPGQEQVVIEDRTKVVVFDPDRLHQQKQQRSNDNREKLAQARKIITNTIENLMKDYEPRSKDFWQMVIKALIEVRNTSGEYFIFAGKAEAKIGNEQGPFDQFYWDMIEMRYLGTRIRDIDKLGISITAYLIDCDSYKERDLQRRHEILKELGYIGSAVQGAEQIIDKYQIWEVQG